MIKAGSDADSGDNRKHGKESKVKPEPFGLKSKVSTAAHLIH